MLEYNIFSCIFDESLIDDIPCILYFYISTGYTTNFTMPGIIVLKNHRQTMLRRGVCVSKDVIIKEILSNESTIDSTVLHHDEWWPDDLQFRHVDIHDFDLIDVPESSNQRTIDIVNYGLFLLPNKDALPCIRSWLKANTRYTSKVTWWTSSRTRRGSNIEGRRHWPWTHARLATILSAT